MNQWPRIGSGDCDLVVSSFLALAMSLGIVSEAHAARHYSGLKYPNSASEGRFPILSEAWGPEESEELKGFTDLLPYVQPSPDQDEAGSCLYMSLTGIAEIWLNQLRPLSDGVQVEGENDLSERDFMNLDLDSSVVKNWKTDTLLGLNKNHSLLRNRSYRFAKGWYKSSAGRLVSARPNANGASYGTMFNWVDQSGSAPNDFASLPTFSRKVIAKDPAGNQWGTAVMPSDIVERVKTALDRDHAPIQVIYNHSGYWHSVIIVGYNDDESSGGCRMVERHIADSYANAAKIKKSYDAEGGCREKGVFYVRDSIYSDSSEPDYVYDPSNPESNAPYSKRIIYREYQWLKYLANHVVEWSAH